MKFFLVIFAITTVIFVSSAATKRTGAPLVAGEGVIRIPCNDLKNCFDFCESGIFLTVQNCVSNVCTVVSGPTDCRVQTGDPGAICLVAVDQQTGARTGMCSAGA